MVSAHALAVSVHALADVAHALAMIEHWGNIWQVVIQTCKHTGNIHRNPQTRAQHFDVIVADPPNMDAVPQGATSAYAGLDVLRSLQLQHEGTTTEDIDVPSTVLQQNFGVWG